MLTHNLDDDAVAYNGQRVTFVCTIVAGCDILITWKSDHYIRPRGDVLQLTSNDTEGSTVNNTRNPTTVATLINTTQSSNGEITVVSELQLTASASYPNSRVSCRANGGRIHTVTFQTSIFSKPE